MKLAVVLVNYNGKKYNEACIESVRAGKTDAQVRIFVVDNASQDGSVQILRERYGKEESVEVKELSDNYGFSHANNVGIRLAGEWGADAVLLLNNDTEIGETMLQELLACADRHPGSMVVPKIYYSDDRLRIWSAGGYRLWWEKSRISGWTKKTGDSTMRSAGLFLPRDAVCLYPCR